MYLDVVDSDIEYSEGCQKDYVEIYLGMLKYTYKIHTIEQHIFLLRKKKRWSINYFKIFDKRIYKWIYT